MLFVFRGIRFFQVLLSVIALALGVSCVAILATYKNTHSPLLLLAAIALGVAFLWGFATCLRAPTSFVAVADNRTRIRFAGFVDTVVDNRVILGARVVNHPWYGGIGVRTNFGGTVTLASISGPVCELVLSQPIRIWMIPKLVPAKARILRVSVRNPEKMVERFGPPSAAAMRDASLPPGGARKMKQQRRR